MIFTYSLYAACLVCILGIAYRIRSWFLYRIGSDDPTYSMPQRIGHAAGAVVRMVFSFRVFWLVFVFVWDVLLQVRILRKSPLRWVMHFSLFAGFTLLLVMHALEDFTSRALFSSYESTLNPYMFLRNFFGALALMGLAIAIFRRRTIKALQQISGRPDWFAIGLLLVIMLSGFLLESAKIVSPSVFESMLADFSGYAPDAEEAGPLKAYWEEYYGVAFPGWEPQKSDQMLAQGSAMHETYCAYCHARPQWAFVSYPVSRALVPVAAAADAIRLDVILWYVHFLACFAALALLPFTKLFHIVSTPVSLLVNSAADSPAGENINRLNRRGLDLDACTNCGTCSLHCSVAHLFDRIRNRYILPSERLSVLKQLASGKPLPPDMLKSIAEGGQICTKCYRCTRLCPAGINLQDIWLAAETQLAELGFDSPGIWVPRACAGTLEQTRVCVGPDEANILERLSTVSISTQDFSECLKCKTCTNVCPVVDAFETPGKELDLMPHQMIHALSLGLKDMVLGSRMIWECTTCYLCQENCPQGVKITDIFYGLKNLAYQQASQAPMMPDNHVTDE